MDCFNHLLSFHNKNDEEYKFIYNLFGAECNAIKCNKISRHYRNRQINNYDVYLDNIERRLLCIQQYFDKIHCHFQHGYDIGHRLTENEIKQMDYDNYNDQKTNGDGDLKNKLIELHNILDKKEIKICKHYKL